MPTVRTFIAIELTAEALRALGQVQEKLRRSPGGQAGRWVRAEGIHLTLKFLGDVPEEKLPQVYQAVEQACQGHQPFEVAFGGLGGFPNLRRPRVIWVGVEEESGQLQSLQRDVEQALERKGFPRERRPFRPHLTLARVRKGASPSEAAALGRSVAQAQVGTLGRMQVKEVSVMRSELTPEGALYSELYKVSLAP